MLRRPTGALKIKLYEFFWLFGCRGLKTSPASVSVAQDGPGHVGDVPMHRLPTQLLLSSEIRYFSAGTPGWNTLEFPCRNSGKEGRATFHTLDIRKSWDSEQILAQECQESHAE